MSRVNLLDFDAAQLAAYVQSLEEKPFRAQASCCAGSTGAGRVILTPCRTLRNRFERSCPTRPASVSPPVLSDVVAADGTRKWLLDVGLGNAIEAVFIPEEDRGTLCISTQAGCAVNCAFCSTGRQGFNRNLTTGEIIGQLWMAEHLLRANAARIGRQSDSRSRHFQRGADGHGRAAAELRRGAARAATDARRQRLRLVTSTRDVVDVGHGAVDGSSGRRTVRLRSRCRCMRRTMRCATRWCR